LNKSVSEQHPTSSAQKAINAVWPFIGTKKARLFLILGIVATGMFFNWGWFVAAGIAPLILGVLPCAAMCALGLCMRPGKDGSCSNSSGQKPKQDIDSNDLK
jgi:hypothetical protein